MFGQIQRLTGRGKDRAAAAAQQMGLEAAAALARRMAAPGVGWEQVLARAIDVMCHSGDSALPAPGQTKALDAALGFLAQAPAPTRQKLIDVVWLVEAGGRVMASPRAPFSSLSLEQATAYLAQWEGAALEPMRAAFAGLKSVCMIGYWSRPGTWEAIGYGLDTELEGEEAG